MKRYQQSLAPLICFLNPDSICMLALLTLEIFLVEINDLLEVHLSHLCGQLDRLLSDRYMDDIREEILALVVEKLVNLDWGCSVPSTVASADHPLMRTSPNFEVLAHH